MAKIRGVCASVSVWVGVCVCVLIIEHEKANMSWVPSDQGDLDGVGAGAGVVKHTQLEGRLPLFHAR